MRSGVEVHPWDFLDATLGGRRVYSLIWTFWLFGAICVHYAQMLPGREEITPGAASAATIGVIGLLLYSWLLIRGLTSQERRGALLAKMSDPPRVSIMSRILIWSVPFLALCAAIAPAIIR